MTKHVLSKAVHDKTCT